MDQGVYKITSQKTGKFYVGSSKNISKRFKQHLSELKKGSHHSVKFQEEYSLYGEYNFRLETIETVTDDEKLMKREQHWIDKLQTFTVGLNSSPYANRPRPLTPEEIRQLSDNRLVLPYLTLPAFPKSDKKPIIVERYGIFGKITDFFSGKKFYDPRSDYEKLCDVTRRRIAVMDGDKEIVEFYLFDYSDRAIWSGGELYDTISTGIFMMVDPVSHKIICKFDKGEEQIRRWLRQNTLIDIKNFDKTASKWLEADFIKQNKAHYCASQRYRRGYRRRY
jgi:predicted GIY-YIG superfamily endonuclease